MIDLIHPEFIDCDPESLPWLGTRFDSLVHRGAEQLFPLNGSASVSATRSGAAGSLHETMERYTIAGDENGGRW